MNVQKRKKKKNTYACRPRHLYVMIERKENGQEEESSLIF
jgi:hypothetical protein